jgi:hypothetical protein
MVIPFTRWDGVRTVVGGSLLGKVWGWWLGTSENRYHGFTPGVGRRQFLIVFGHAKLEMFVKWAVSLLSLEDSGGTWDHDIN